MLLEDILANRKNEFTNIINIKNKKLLKFDFTANNKDLTEELINDTEKFSDYLTWLLKKSKADIGYGGYLEDRILYKKSEHFGGNDSNSRTIHLGLDIWCKAGEAVYAPYNAKIHSFKINDNYGDYGPTIILEHCIASYTFYTLYGHLSINSLHGIVEGKIVNKGDKIAELGNERENGNWPPHLHFQLIKDLEQNIGDYPGVCRANEQHKFKLNCPNPTLILQL